MKEILEYTSDTVGIDDIKDTQLVLAKKNGKFVGMIIYEYAGWILRFSGGRGATGHHSTLKKCIKSCIHYGYTFYAEEL